MPGDTFGQRSWIDRPQRRRRVARRDPSIAQQRARRSLSPPRSDRALCTPRRPTRGPKCGHCGSPPRLPEVKVRPCATALTHGPRPARTGCRRPWSRTRRSPRRLVPVRLQQRRAGALGARDRADGDSATRTRLCSKERWPLTRPDRPARLAVSSSSSCMLTPAAARAYRTGAHVTGQRYATHPAACLALSSLRCARYDAFPAAPGRARLTGVYSRERALPGRADLDPQRCRT